MIMILFAVFLLLLILFCWIVWRWSWGWLGWLIPGALFMWIMIFVTGLQRNWDSSYYFLCELRQLIGEVSGLPETIRWPSLAAGGLQWGTAIGAFAASLICIVILTLRARRGKSRCGATVFLGVFLLFCSTLAGTVTVDGIMRQLLLQERQAALAEMRAHIAAAQNAKVPKSEILACLQDCREHCAAGYEHAELGRQSIQYARNALRKLAGK